MILFIIIAVCILIYTIFADTWLIHCIKEDIKGPRPVRDVLYSIGIWFGSNLLLNAANATMVFLISMGALFVAANVCPEETSQWEFNINALEDNLVTEGRLYGRRGHVDGELSYFYSRTLTMGEKIEHIPANKTYVQYSDTERPHVEVHQSRIDIPEWMNKVFWLEPFNTTSTDYYILVVPEGTITNSGQYAIDMS